ncbi:MAG: iron-containing alcohol dehydrogenase [Treponema sp.]|nr:iron-containing alcohol dehydrogenase [Treponema sp.]
MQNFHYYTPTQVVFGRDTEVQSGSLVKQYGGTKVLVHFGGKSAVQSGLLDRVCKSLEKEGISYITLGGAQPNPRLSLVQKGIDLCKKEKVDFLFAVGGGSVIDSCKAIGYGLANDCPVWDIYDRKTTPKACAPIGCVVTIAAAGSEMSDSSVITNEDGNQKRGFSSDYCRLKFAIMNPELTCTLPAWQTASGCTDIIMHTLERWFSSSDDNSQLIDSIAVALIKTVITNAQILVTDPTNYNARAEIMWAGSLSHNGLTGPYGNGDWACHQIEHELGGMFDVTHGAGLAAVWGTWARYVYKHNIKRFAELAVQVFNLPKPSKDNEEQTALEGISRMESFFKSINMPTSISQLGLTLTDAQCEQLAHNCTWNLSRTVGCVQKLGKAELAEIYKLAR